MVIQKEKIKEIKSLIKKRFNRRDLAQKIIEIQPIYYDFAGIFWIWNFENNSWKITDETDILNFIYKIIKINTVDSKEKSRLIEAIKQEARLNKPENIKKSWIQFQKEIVDINTNEKFLASPKYFITNPIPFKIGLIEETPTIDKIFSEWVGEEHKKTLYEIIAYCLLPDYPIHRLFCLIGEGLNGKSCYLRLLKKFIGDSNTSSTELDLLLDSRFEIVSLYKKLVCIMGETNFNQMKKTSILKKLTGQDLIGFEFKRKDHFEDINYAKILIATNNLPATDDKTIGFYRRWLIIDFPNSFSEKIDILSSIPEVEYQNLALKSIRILKELLEKKEFHNEGTIEERMKKFEDKSNPLDKFIRENCEESFGGFIWKFEFQKKFDEWCKENRFRKHSEMSIGLRMKELNFSTSRRLSTWEIEGEKRQLRTWENIRFKNSKIEEKQTEF